MIVIAVQFSVSPYVHASCQVKFSLGQGEQKFVPSFWCNKDDNRLLISMWMEWTTRLKALMELVFVTLDIAAASVMIVC